MHQLVLIVAALGVLASCAAIADEELASEEAGLAHAKGEFIDPAWYVAPWVGFLVSPRGHGTANLILVRDEHGDAQQRSSSSTILTAGHVFGSGESSESSGQWQLDSWHRSYGVFFVSDDASAAYFVPIKNYFGWPFAPREKDLGVARLFHPIGRAQLGDQPLPFIAESMPKTNKMLPFMNDDVWFVGFGYDKCNDGYNRKPEVYEGSGIKRAGSARFRPLESQTSLRGPNAIVQKRRVLAGCPGDSGGPLAMAQEGMVPAYQHIDRIVGISSAGQSEETWNWLGKWYRGEEIYANAVHFRQELEREARNQRIQAEQNGEWEPTTEEVSYRECNALKAVYDYDPGPAVYAEQRVCDAIEDIAQVLDCIATPSGANCRDAAQLRWDMCTAQPTSEDCQRTTVQCAWYARGCPNEVCLPEGTPDEDAIPLMDCS